MPGDSQTEYICPDDISINSLAHDIKVDSTNVSFQDPCVEDTENLDDRAPSVAHKIDSTSHKSETDESDSHVPEADKSDRADPLQPDDCECCIQGQTGKKCLTHDVVTDNITKYHHFDCSRDNESSLYYSMSNAYRKIRNKFHLPSKNSHICSVNKLSAYRTEESRKRYVFPSPANEAKDEDMCLTDDRNFLEVFGDVLGVIMDQYDPEDVEWLSRVVGYDVTIPQISPETGVHMPQELLKHLVREYKEMNGIKNINKSLREHIDKVLGESPEKPGGESTNIQDEAEVDTSHDQPDQLDAEGCVEFMAGHVYVLESAAKRRLFRILKNRKKAGKSLTNKKSIPLLREMQSKYMCQKTKKWLPPEANETNLPGQCFLVAKGIALFHLHGEVGTNDKKLVDFSCLLDTGATHDLLPMCYVRKHNINLGTLRKRGKMHLFTAGSEVKNSVEGECTITVCITGRDGEKYYAPVNFLVVNDNLSINKPILGRPWHKLFACHARYDSDTVTARLFNKDWEKVRIEIPHTSKSGTAAFCNTVVNIDQAEDSELDPDAEAIDEDTEVDDLASEMVGSVLQVFGHTPARDVFTSLGGDSNEVTQEVKDDLDDLVFDRMDLLATLNGLKKSKVKSKPCKSIKEKYIKQINDVVSRYPEAVSTEDKITGRFKYWNYSPDVIPGKTASQKNRNTRIDQFPAAVEKMKELQRHGIIQVSDSQSKDFIHNILIQHKRKTDQVGRGWSKADQAIESRHNKLSDPNVKIRLLNDMTTFNYCLRHIPTISLPRETEIRSFIRNKYVSLLDLKNMFYSICVDPSAYHYFNFYYNKTIMTITRLCQGLASSPYVAVEALKRTFDQSVWKALFSKKKDELTLLFKYYNSLEEINISFIDDILIASYVLCKCTGERCDKGIECPTFDQDLTCQLHIECFEAIVWAIEQSGFLIETKKMELFVQSKFIFLGTEYSSTCNQYGIAMDRAKSILNFRIPRSVPELGSRLSALFWSAPTIPYVKKVAIPLSKILLQNHFEWGPRQMKAWNNVKLLVSMAISILNIFDENRYGVLVSDSSKWSASYTFYQIDENGRLLLVQTDTKVLNGNESRRVAFHREISCSTWAMGEIEHFILASKKHVLVLADAQSVLYMKQAQAWDNALGKMAMYVSKFQQVIVSFLPGKFMGVCDILSRQFHNAFISKPDAPLSRIMSEIVAPPPKSLQGKTFLMTPNELTDYLVARNKKTKLDLWDRGEVARQDLREYDLKKCLEEAQPLQSLLKYLKDPYNIKNLNTRTVKDLFRVLSGASKTKIDAFLKDTQLDYLRTALKSIDYKSDWKMVYQPISLENCPPVIGWEPDLSEPDDTDQSQAVAPACTMIWSKASEDTTECNPILPLAPACPGEGSPAGQVTMVTTRAQKLRATKFCPSDHNKTIDINDIQCDHMKSVSSKIVITNKCFENFCRKFDFWVDFVFRIRQVTALMKDHPDFETLLVNLAKFERHDCLIQKLISVRDTCVLLSSSQMLPNILQSNMTKVLVVLYSWESEDWMVTEKGGKLLVRMSRDITLDPLDFVQLKGHCIILNQDIVVTHNTKLSPHLKLYYDITHVHVSLCQSISAYNTDITPITIKKGETIFEISVSGAEDMTVYYAQVPKEQSDQLLGCLSHLVMTKERCRLTEIMSDYFCEVNNIVVSDAQAAMSGCTMDPIEVATVNTVADILGNTDEEVDQLDNQVRAEGKLEYHGKLELSALLFSHQLRRGRKYISKERMVALQNSDIHLVRIKEAVASSPQLEDETSKQLFVLENDILYRNTFIHKYNTTFKTLCLPTFLLKMLIQNLHTYYQLHIGTSELYTLLRTAIYSKNMFGYLREARLSCPVCIFSHPAESRKVRGNKLLWRNFRNGPNFICYVDLCELPYCHAVRSSMAMVYMCGLTQYTVAIPLSDKTDSSIVKAFRQIYSILPTPGIVASDAGSEFISGKTRAFLENLHVQQYFPGTKDGNSLIEGGIKIFKQLLNAYVQRAGGAPGDWADAYIMALQTMNAKHTGKFGLLSRRDMFLSPLTYCNPLQVSISGDAGDLPRVHKTHIKKKYDSELRLVSKRGGHGVNLYKGRVVRKTLPRIHQPSTNGSRQLGPSTERFLKIRKVLAGGKLALAKCLSSGKNMKTHVEELRPLALWPWPDAAVKMKNLVNFVPDVHSHKYAKKLAGCEEPHLFAIECSQADSDDEGNNSQDQSEDESDECDQSEGVASDADQSEAGSWSPPVPSDSGVTPKSILKVRKSKIHQPLMATLSRNQGSRALLKCYKRAFRLNLYLHKSQPEYAMPPPDWATNLVQQTPTFGTNLMCHNNELTPAIACSHKRRVNFGNDVTPKEYIKYFFCNEEGLGNLMNKSCTSAREAAVAHICCFSCLSKNLDLIEEANPKQETSDQ